MTNRLNKIFIYSLIFNACMLNAQQKGTSEIKIGYGVLSSNEIGKVFSDIITAPFSYAEPKATDEKHSGALFIGYNYAIKDNWTIGTDLVYERYTASVKDQNHIIASQKNDIYTLAVNSTYSYISKPKFRMYSGVGLGYTFSNEKLSPNQSDVQSMYSKNSSFNFQVIGAGVRIGGKLAGFAELGFGYKGIINLGISYQL
ncbi:outer membrane protein with beta-barrel domain [Chryseobacterium sp. CBTAP 102]|uniref:outer membrane beta-barrel protein n=1 Tax=Chryseobacterium sp. CBTAP 102 TaxID=2135644 RepID=UPI000D766C5F|nr:outer membrane beta-barrel protein [Chryseobacterium sp. CBTAP 102]PXW18318.1 outer membrane protein with beta-barrel domain [Chryseobacterium sp. CBTAP 102]